MSAERQFDRHHPYGHTTRCGWKAEITSEYVIQGNLGEERKYFVTLHLPSGQTAYMGATLNGRHDNNQPDLDLINYYPSEPLT